MLDAFIIEEIKRRERLRQEQDRPVVELPVPAPEDKPRRSNDTHDDDDKPGRGVVVIDLAV